MAWTYSSSSLGTSTATERLNAVRYLVGDTDINDQQVQDEEITFALSQSSDNIYFAASFVADTISSLYSRRVTTKLDGALSAEYSDLAEQYRKLSANLRQQGYKYGGSSLGIAYGGLKKTDVDAIREDTTRVTPSFRMDRFRNGDNDYLSDYVDE
jgi:hypothetical protein